MTVRMRFLLGFAGLVAVLLAAPLSAAASEVQSTSPVLSLPSFNEIPHAQSELIRVDDRTINFSFHTFELSPGIQATLLLVIFNNPAACHNGTPPVHCGEADLNVSDVHASVILVTQTTVPRDGTLGAGGTLAVNDTTNALRGPGLTNPQGADVHFVVQQSGAFVQASIHEAG